MKGKDIIEEFKEYVEKVDPELLQSIQVQASIAQMNLHEIHARAIACHCECLGMNAENSIAACAGNVPPYNDDAYLQCLQKWNLIDEKGEVGI